MKNLEEILKLEEQIKEEKIAECARLHYQWLKDLDDAECGLDAERELYETVLEYDKIYFDDMVFKDGSIVTPFIDLDKNDGAEQLERRLYVYIHCCPKKAILNRCI